VSGATGIPVKLLTVKALLSPTALERLNRVAHRFCPDATCEVVYFDELGNWYGKHEIRVSVWQKEPFGARTICYCFGESEGSICTEVTAEGSSAAANRVRAHIAAGRCACQVRNPKGSCCLGDITAAVSRVISTLNSRSDDCSR
jgi:hypothetical protein